MYTHAAPELKPNHFVMTYQLADLFAGTGLDKLTELGCTIIQMHLDGDDEEVDRICVDGVCYDFADECGMAQTCELDLEDDLECDGIEHLFQFANDAVIMLQQSGGYRGQGNYEAIVKQNGYVYCIDIVSEGTVQLLEPIQPQQ